MELTKKDTKMLQGLSVLAMVWLHLFDTWNYKGLFYPLLFFKGIPVAVYIAQLSDFCVMGFAFCSGYAHYKISQRNDYYKSRLRSLFKLIIRYWTVLIVFCIVSVFAGKQGYMPASLRSFLLHFFFLGGSYNGAWWYLFAYVVIVLVSPFLLSNIRKKPLLVTALISAVLYCLSYYYRFRIHAVGVFLSRLGPLGMTVVEYIMGAVAAKINYFTLVGKIWNRIARHIRAFLSIVLLLIMLIFRTLIVPSMFVAPVTGLVIITLFHIWKKPDLMERFFLFIGAHSTHIWLTHMFFYLYLFNGLVYKAIYPLAIYAFMIVITLTVSVILNYIEKPIYSALNL